ncbi:MAG: DNA repair exonuclease [Clostridia bacterium]|nr:DNA repair exonuclease [Clostridia bacterium]
MVKVFHCADIHLDSPFSLCSPREAEKKRIELRAAFTSALMYAREKKTDIFIISGDLFDGEYVTRDTRELLMREFAKCGDMKIFIAPGNHDHLGAGSAYETAEFPSNVHVFGGERECVRLGELGVDIYGFGYTSKQCLSSPVANWNIRDKERINILVCHGDMYGISDTTGPISKKDIAESGFDYIALGHIHKGTGLLCENGVYYAYSGCIEGRGFDELGYKGAMFGTIEKGNVDMQMKRFSKSRYETVSVDISGLTEKMEVLDVIRQAIRSYTDDTSLRLTLTGELNNAFVILPNEIGKGCEYPYYIEIIDQTYIVPALGELEQSNTLKGVFVRKIMAEMSGLEPTSDEYRVLSLALKYGIAALDDRSVVDYTGGEKA